MTEREDSYISGTIRGGIKARDTNKRLYGQDYYSRIGGLNLESWIANGRKPRGFAYSKANGLDTHKKAGRIGGLKSKRGPAKAKAWGGSTIVAIHTSESSPSTHESGWTSVGRVVDGPKKKWWHIW